MGMVVLLACLAGSPVNAQTAVTSITYQTLVDTTNRTADNIRYLNQYHAVDTISTATETYYFDGTNDATNVYFRRNTSSGNPNNATVFYQYQNAGTNPAKVYGVGDTSPTLEEVMLSNDLTQGLRNPFANSGGTSSLNSNIERIDFRLPDYVVSEGEALVFFDLENVGNFGDGFRIAAVTSWGTYNGTSAPTAYANSGLLVAPDSFGNPVTTPTGTNATYLRSTTTSGDNISANQTIATLDTNSGTANSSDLYLVGIVITFADLGIAAGTTIQGFSLMAGDVAPTTANSLLNWNNSTVYRTDTDSTTWGNMDFMAFGAQIARPVPEPATYGALLIGATCGLLGWRRYRRVLAATAPTA